MNKTAELITELCENLQRNLNQHYLEPYPKDAKIDNKVEFFSGLKPANYFMPMMYMGTGVPPDGAEPEAWFCEIFVNRICIFRESWYINPTEDINICEGACLTRLLNAVFAHGVMGAKKILEDRDAKAPEGDKRD